MPPTEDRRRIATRLMVLQVCVIAVFAVLGKVITSSALAKRGAVPSPETSVKALGQKLMADYILPLEVLALLLTAAMIGAVIIALREKEGAK